jgi:hypothetical protein
MLLRCCLVERVQRMLLAALQAGAVGQQGGGVSIAAQHLLNMYSNVLANEHRWLPLDRVSPG